MNELFENVGVVPVVVLDNAEDAIPVAEALREGGLSIIEVTLRTAAAPEAIRLIADEVSDVIIGAGTVLNAEQVGIAAGAGARFIVSPGLHDSVVAESNLLTCPSSRWSPPHESDRRMGHGPGVSSFGGARWRKFQC